MVEACIKVQSLGPRTAWLLFAAVSGLLLLSGIHPFDRLTWFMEVIWVLAALGLLLWLHPRFALTRLLYVLIALHAILLIVGGHYTYAEVPLGRWFQEWFGLARNHYDRLGHFAQGVIPALLARELLLRHHVVRRGAWLFYLCVACALSFSAFFEMIEWWAALVYGAQADAFLATQGDVWDTQWDMFMALCGAVSAQWLLARQHDRELGRTDP